MGMKKEFLLRAIWVVFDKTRRNPHFFKKIVGVTLALGLFIMAGFGLLLYFAVGIGQNLIAKTADLDLLAVEQLVAEKSMALSEEQRRLLAPVIEGLAASGLAPAQTKALKEQFFEIITPAQLAKLEAWKADAATKTAGLFTLPPAVAAIIEKYTGLSQETVEVKIDSILAWWKITIPDNSAEQLEKTLRNP